MPTLNPRRKDIKPTLKLTSTPADEIKTLVARLNELVGGNRNKSESEYDPNESYPEIPVGRGVTAQLTWWTVEKATEFIASMDLEKQRSTKDHHMSSLIRDAQAGIFQFNSQPIIYDWNGKGIDGGHRSKMVISTEIPILVLVVRGVNPEAFQSIDSIASRSQADALKSMTSVTRTVTAAACRRVWEWENGCIGYEFHRVSPSLTKVVFRNHPDLAKSVSATNASGRVIHSHASAAFAHYVASMIDADKASTFFHQLGTGEGLFKGDPVLALRNRTDTKGLNATQILELIIKSWNIFYRDGSIDHLKLNTASRFPKFTDDPIDAIEEIDDEESEEAA